MNDTRVGDIDIKAAKSVFNFIRKAALMSKVRNIARDTDSAAANLCNGALQHILSPACNNHLRALLRKQPGRFLANAAVTARYKCDLSFQRFHKSISPISLAKLR